MNMKIYLRNGKPGENRGRKAKDLRAVWMMPMTAGCRRESQNI